MRSMVCNTNTTLRVQYLIHYGISLKEAQGLPGVWLNPRRDRG